MLSDRSHLDFFVLIHNSVENKLVKMYKERAQGLSEMRNPDKIAVFHCTKSKKWDKIKSSGRLPLVQIPPDTCPR